MSFGVVCRWKYVCEYVEIWKDLHKDVFVENDKVLSYEVVYFMEMNNVDVIQKC